MGLTDWKQGANRERPTLYSSRVRHDTRRAMTRAVAEKRGDAVILTTRTSTGYHALMRFLHKTCEYHNRDK